jgi:predicted DNA-binding transcriptional regulator AlpA
VTVEVADRLVPQPKVEQEFDRTAMTLYRWLRDSALQFPRPVKIRNRNYWLRSDLDAFKRRMVDEALKER